ncbi:hypothetical protein V1514DRAFT_328474 [Lipomyces japonicus]|uniref:uncharacterized protein n=1 Tax=Lipomyces japonicus TaxID=56871 RepID=UPI0034CFB6BE
MGRFNSILSQIGQFTSSKLYYHLRGYSTSKFLDPDIDIVVITGGSNGLGAKLARQLTESSISVVVLDVVEPVEKLQGVCYIKCDISSREQVLDAAFVIKQEIGDVTVLINNAAITQGKTILDLTFEEIDNTMKINLVSNFYTVKAFLPGMVKLRRGYVVTISSVTGYVGPIKLGAYAASKAGLLCLHDSLTYELGPDPDSGSGVRTILVATGQMSTHLFEGVQTPSRSMAPILDTTVVADRICLALQRGEQGRITMPTYARFMPLMRILPRSVMTAVRYLSGIDRGMDDYTGVYN